MAEQTGIFFVSPINPRNSKEQKDAYGWVISVFLKTGLEKYWLHFRNTIEQTFNQLKNNDRLDQPTTLLWVSWLFTTYMHSYAQF
jgi:hypothetical protein